MENKDSILAVPPETIRERMAELALSQTALAERAGVHRVTLNRFLMGRSGVDNPTLERLVGALDGRLELRVEWRDRR